MVPVVDSTTAIHTGLKGLRLVATFNGKMLAALHHCEAGLDVSPIETLAAEERVLVEVR